jgi:hypothetical protein
MKVQEKAETSGSIVILVAQGFFSNDCLCSSGSGILLAFGI